MAKFVVTGGAGFIGCNTVERLLRDGQEVIVIDNLSRKGTESNLAYLQRQGEFNFVRAEKFPQVKTTPFRTWVSLL